MSKRAVSGSPRSNGLCTVGTNLFETNAHGVNVFPLTAAGNVAPTRTIGGAATMIPEPLGCAVDAAGNLYVADNYNTTVDVFAPGAMGDVAPTRSISGTNAFPSGTPFGIALDSAGNIYTPTFNGQSISVFAAGANGNVAPIASINGALTQLDYPGAIAIH